MLKGLVGRKVGMTQVYGEGGRLVPVTVLELGPCTVVQTKTKATDGYGAVQLGFEPKKEKRTSKALLGHFKKAGSTPFRILREFRLEDPESLKAGQVVSADLFKVGDLVDVTASSKGKGFQGVIKRHHFKGGPATHGSMFHREPGSIGASAFPSRVIKGHRHPGHMGDRRVTVQNLEVVEVKADEHLVLLKGAVPGANGSHVVVRAAVKAAALAAAPGAAAR
jgi:large subunit ribosomal protein L3